MYVRKIRVNMFKPMVSYINKRFIGNSNISLSNGNSRSFESVSSSFIRKFNDMTGYTQVNQLKNKLSQSESHYYSMRNKLSDKRAAYLKVVTTRGQLHRDMNTLLQKKHAWSPADLEKFTSIYTKEHEMDLKEKTSREEMERIESELEDAHSSFMDTMRERYREEQIWSDWMRGISLAGTMGLMFVNLALGVVFYGWIEPTRRKNLAENIVTRISQLIPSYEEESKITKNDDISSLDNRSGNDKHNFTSNIEDILNQIQSQTAIIQTKLADIHQNTEGIRSRNNSLDLSITRTNDRITFADKMTSRIVPSTVYEHPSLCILAGGITGAALSFFVNSFLLG